MQKNELSRFLTLELDEDVHVVDIIDGEQAHTSNSYYFIIRASNQKIYQLGFSNHYNAHHREDFNDLYRFFNNVDIIPRLAFKDIVKHLDAATGTDASKNTAFNDKDIKYNVVECDEYDENTLDQMLGKIAISKAFTSKAYVFDSYTLSNDKRLLYARFTDIKSQHYTTELYVNFYPCSDPINFLDLAQIKFLVNHMDIPKAKKTYYRLRKRLILRRKALFSK